MIPCSPLTFQLTMFHSAGYFRGVLCPFHEHGLCHRPHCHYRHTKPASKSKSAKKLPPKLRSRLVTPSQPPHKDGSERSSTATENVKLTQQDEAVAVQDKPVASTGLTSQAADVTVSTEKNAEVPGGSELCNKVATEVSKMIGEIANFYGSGSADYLGGTSYQTGQTGLTDIISSPPQISSEETAVTSLPCYAPEKVLTEQANYHAPLEEEKSNKMASLSEGPQESPTSNVATIEESVDVAMLENMLVTERDIFGNDNGMSDDDDDDDDADKDDDVSAINSNIGDDVIAEHKMPSAEELASIEEEFKKVTALPHEGGTSTEAAAKKRKSQKSGSYVDVSLKKKRVAHSDTEVVREPVKLQTAHVASSNFSLSLDKSCLYMGKKRLAKAPQEAPAAKRPKLQTTVNAKIPTKIRQRFIDSFIDEFLKTNPHPEQAYEKALDEEKVLFERSSSKMIYMNVSTLALKRIRNQTQAQLEEMRKRSDARVEALTAKSGGVDKTRKDDEKIQPSSSLREESGESVTNVANKSSKPEKTQMMGSAKKGGWRSLEAELQATFGNKKETLSSTVEASRTSLSSSTSDSRSVVGVSTPPTTNAMFSSSNFYAKKTSTPSGKSSTKSSTSGSKSREKSKMAHSKQHTKDKSSQQAKEKQLSSRTDDLIPLDERCGPLNEQPQEVERKRTRKDKAIRQTSSHGSAPKAKQMGLTSTGREDLPSMPSTSDDVGTSKRVSAESLTAEGTSADSASISADLASVRSVRRTSADSAKGQSAESVKKGRNSGSGSSYDDPIDLSAELFGDSGSDLDEGVEGERMPVFPLEDVGGDSSEGGGSVDEGGVGSSLGISFESVLCSMVGGTSKKGVAKSKTSRGSKTHTKKRKNKSKDESSRRSGKSDDKARRNSSISDELKSKQPAQLDLTKFTLKSPTLCLSRTPTSLPPTLPLSPSEPMEMTNEGGASEGVASPVETNEVEGHQSESDLLSVGESISTTSEERESKKKSLAPSYLPCGPLINLTKVATKKSNSIPSLNKQAKLERLLGMKKKKTPPSAPPSKAGNASHQRPTYSIIRRKEIEMTAPLFYNHMKSYLLTEDQLRDNGYPRSTSRQGEASIQRELAQSDQIHPVGPNAMQHRCSRCGKPFIIYNSGQYQSLDECIYHYGKLIKNREYGEGLVSKYTCCQGRRDSAGCQVAKFHVTAGERLSLDKGYVVTGPPPSDSAYQPAVYALDCEMCYTTLGLQLTRVSVINMALEPIYERLVKPSHPIVDYNTRFSGLSADDFIGIETTLEDVQQELLRMFYSDTILLGHSLESDLRAMKIIHSTVVDTALVFPHRKGLPYKRALKTLMAEYMQRFIQDSVDGGHDSLEDSRACMELMLWKVKQDLKKLSRRSSTSETK